MRHDTERGQSFLATVLLVGVIIAAIGVTLLFLANSFLNIGYGYRASVNAEAVATSGAEDALLQLDRNSGFQQLSPGYNVTVGSQTATVTVTQGSPASGEATIVSSATVSGSKSTITVIVSVNAATNQVQIVSWQSTS
jgi:hypothetical protein